MSHDRGLRFALRPCRLRMHTHPVCAPDTWDHRTAWSSDGRCSLFSPGRSVHARKMVQRCLQLSLRLSTKLRSLPPDQPLHAFCKAATRNNSCRRHTSPDADVDVNGRAEAFPVERGGAVFSPGDNRGWRTTERGAVTPVCRSVAGEWDGGKSDYVARRRYTDIVQEVVSAWCRDPGSFALDPLWLLPKLRVHRNW